MPWECPCGKINADNRQSCKACGYGPFQPFPNRPSTVNDLRAMGGTGAAKLTFGASFGVAAGWLLGRFFGRLMILAIAIGGIVLFVFIVKWSSPKVSEVESAPIAAPSIETPVDRSAKTPLPQTNDIDTKTADTIGRSINNAPIDSMPTSESAPVPTVVADPAPGILCDGPVRVPQYGQLVFKDLPGQRLKFTFDHDLWQPSSIHREANGTQTLTMRSLAPGIQSFCYMRWEIIR